MATSDIETLTLLCLRLKGTSDAESVAAYYDLEVPAVEAVIEDAWGRGLVEARRGRFPGVRLTPAGRAESERLLGVELDMNDLRSDLEAAYDDFLGVNGDLLEVCTAWQLRTVDGASEPNDHRDASYDNEVIARLVQVHRNVTPVLDRLVAALDRFAGHRDRLASALAKLRAGDTDYFTKPMFPSYHSAWFELHEDLLATLGRSRTAEVLP